jgi:methyl-accepting chemotaxis protein
MVVQHDVNSMRNDYARQWNNGLAVDEISHMFGWADYMKYYGHMQANEQYIKSVFAGLSILGTLLQPLRDALVGINGYVYEHEYQNHYNKGVDTGRKIVGRVETAVTDLTSKIITEINTAKNWIIVNITNPLDDKVQQFNQQVNEFSSRISSMGVTLDGFNSTIAQAKTNAERALSDAKNAINQAANVETNLNTAADKLNEIVNVSNLHTSQIKELYAKFGQSPTSQTNPISEFIKKLRNL